MAISFVGQATANANTVPLPPHQAGDLILIAAYRNNSTTVPTNPAEWTSLFGAGSQTNAMRVGYLIATSSDTVSGTWTNASHLVAMVYRAGTGSSLVVGAVAGQGGTGTGINYPNLTLQDTSGASWLVAFGGHRSNASTTETPPTGFVNRAKIAGASAGSIGAHDTDGPRTTNFVQTGVVVGTSTGWRANVVEITETGGGGGQTFAQSVTVSVTDMVSFGRSAAKSLAVAANDNVSVGKGASRRISTVAGAAASVLKGIGKVLGLGAVTTVLASAAKSAQQFIQSISVSVGTATGMIKGAVKRIGVSALAGAATSTRRAFVRIVSPTATSAVAMSRASTRSFATTASSSVSAARSFGKRVGAAVAGLVSISSIRAVGVLISVALGSAVSGRRAASKGVVIAASAAVEARKAISRRIAAAVTSIGQASAIRAFLLTVQVAVGTLAVVGRRTNKALYLPSIGAVAVQIRRALLRVIYSFASSAVTLRKGVGKKVFSAASSAVGVLASRAFLIAISVLVGTVVAGRRASVLTLAASTLAIVRTAKIVSLSVRAAAQAGISVFRGFEVVLSVAVATVSDAIATLVGFVKRAFGTQPRHGNEQDASVSRPGGPSEPRSNAQPADQRGADASPLRMNRQSPNTRRN